MGATDRQAARQAGKKYYRTGKRCRNGHDALRKVENGRCVICERSYQRDYIGRPAIIAAKRAKAKLRDYQINAAQLDAMMKAQGSRCAVCQCEFGFERHNAPNVDHNHETGVIRGLLCSPCNLGIGNARESVNILRSMIFYLQQK
jgi:hypothetical protein